MQIHFNLLQILTSKLCHDLISPAGSLNFAISLLKEEKSVDNKEAFDIATTSVDNLLNKLS